MHPSPERASSLRVVLVSPDASLREAFAALISTRGHTAAHAPSVQAGVGLCHALGPELVLLDDRLGEEAITAFKADPDLFDTSLLLCGPGALTDEALGRGVQDHLGMGTDALGVQARVRTAGLLAQLRREMGAQAGRLESLAYTDDLTRVFNRRYVAGQLSALVASATRHGRDLAVVLVDLDRFKPVNDQHGHAAGDRVLAAVAERMSERLRQEDVLGRWGGEEFLALLPDTDGRGAVALAESLRAAVGEVPVRWHGKALTVTVSSGVAVRTAGEAPDELLRRADAALYAAKDAGRDRVILAPPTLGEALRAS